MSEELRPEIARLPDALAPVDRSQFMPAMSIELAVERYNTITEFVSRVLRRDVDYGMIPGTDKLTLLKPGAEKLTTFFGLSTRFRLIERIEDWTGEDHNGEPFFYYLYRCQLSRGEDNPDPWTKQTDVFYRDEDVFAWINPTWWGEIEGNAGAGIQYETSCDGEGGQDVL